MLKGSYVAKNVMIVVEEAVQQVTKSSKCVQTRGLIRKWGSKKGRLPKLVL